MEVEKKLPSWDEWTTLSVFKVFDDLVFKDLESSIKFRNGYEIIVIKILTYNIKPSHRYALHIIKDGEVRETLSNITSEQISKKMIEIQKIVKSKPKSITKKDEKDSFFYHSKIDGSPIYKRSDGTHYKIRHDGKLIKLKKA